MRRLSVAWWTDKYIYAILLVFPLFVGFRGYTQTTISKFVFWGALTLLWLGFGMWALKRERKLSIEKPEMKIVRLIAAYLCFCILSAACSPYGGSVIFGEGRFDGLVTILLSALAFFSGAFLTKAKPGYLYASMCAGTVCCIIGILQLFGLNPLGLFPADYDYYDAGIEFTGSFFGTIGNADLVSAYICLLLPMGAACYILAEKRPIWLLPVLAVLGFSLKACGVAAGLLASGCVALLMPVVLIKSGKRLRRGLECTAVLAAVLSLALCFHSEKADGNVRIWLGFSKDAAIMLILAIFAGIARLVFSHKEFGAKSLRVFLGCLSAVTLLGALISVYFFAPKSGTLWEISQVLHGNWEDSFGSSRILIWREVLDIVPQRPLLGGGPGTLALRIDIGFSRYVEETGKTLTAYIDNAHNEYLGILANTGLFSLLCYLAAQAVSIVLALKRGNTAALCLIAGLICYWIQDFFGLGLFLVSPLMWICWGLLVHELCKPKSKDAE